MSSIFITSSLSNAAYRYVLPSRVLHLFPLHFKQAVVGRAVRDMFFLQSQQTTNSQCLLVCVSEETPLYRSPATTVFLMLDCYNHLDQYLSSSQCGSNPNIEFTRLLQRLALLYIKYFNIKFLTVQGIARLCLSFSIDNLKTD